VEWYFYVLMALLVSIVIVVERYGVRRSHGQGIRKRRRDALVDFVCKWWTLLFLSFAVANYLFVLMRGIYIGGILCLSVALVFFQAIYRLMRHMMHHTNKTAARLRLAFLVLILPFFILSLISVMHVTALVVAELKTNKSFEERVDPFIYGAEKIYEAGVWPNWLYGTLQEKLFKGVYRPEIYNTDHRYLKYNAEFYHVDEVGVAQYSCQGDHYGEFSASRSFFFICQAEDDGDGGQSRISVWDNLTDSPCDTMISPLDIGGTQARLVEVWVDDEFDYTRTICHSSAMRIEGDLMDGFVFDMAHVAHPPDSSQVVLVTNHKIDQPEVVRMVPQQSFWSWLFARPKYSPATGDYGLAICTDDSVRNKYRGHIEHYREKGSEDDAELQPIELPIVYMGSVANAGAHDVYLIRYRLR